MSSELRTKLTGAILTETEIAANLANLMKGNLSKIEMEAILELVLENSSQRIKKLEEIYAIADKL